MKIGRKSVADEVRDEDLPSKANEVGAVTSSRSSYGIEPKQRIELVNSIAIGCPHNG
jgi:hypothetical protein